MCDPPWINIEDYLEDFFRLCLPDDASDWQRLETTKIFYAGVLALFALIGEVKKQLPPEAWPHRLNKAHGVAAGFFEAIYGQEPVLGPTLH